MSLEQTTELYASVLRQLLPEGVYDTAEMTHVADDIYAHAKALAQADIDAHRLLQVLETIPVDLLADYEREYGLPMQCMMPGSQTIEERISVLRWIRQHRNVMNRKYLEQILAIFGITLVDVVKHRPMLCTASCTSPVNTERLRYKVLLRLQYPMTADMSCIIENYLPGYLRVEWVVDMPWGEWILNAGFELSGENIRYTAYKTNQRDFYDSYADFDLVTALVRSFHDNDMRQWQAVKDAANELTNTDDWIFNQESSTIDHFDKSSPNYNAFRELFWINGVVLTSAVTPEESCAKAITVYGEAPAHYTYKGFNTNGVKNYCSVSGSGRYDHGFQIYSQPNPNYDSTAAPYEEMSIPITDIVQKIISNTQSLTEATAIHAENYINQVANSILTIDPSKQFVKLLDLLSQFELNKTLRI